MIAQRFNLTFSKSWSETKGISYRVNTTEKGWTNLAMHLTSSSFADTRSQLNALNPELDGKSIAERWCKIAGDYLPIDPDRHTIKVGEQIISLGELRELLLEWLDFLQPFNLDNEVARVSKYTLLPISHITFDGRIPLDKPFVEENGNFIKLHAKLYLKEHFIGEIPYMLSHFGPMYDTGENKLINWKRVTEVCHQEIFNEILKREPAAFSVESQAFGELIVNNKGGQAIKKAYCHYVDKKWQIVLSGFDEIEITKSVTVSLNVPPPAVD